MSADDFMVLIAFASLLVSMIELTIVIIIAILDKK